MSEKALKFDNIEINKKEFHKSKQSIYFIFSGHKQNSNISDAGFYYFFIGYKEDDIVKLLSLSYLK